jgi:hypothetical protein
MPLIAKNLNQSPTSIWRMGDNVSIGIEVRGSVGGMDGVRPVCVALQTARLEYLALSRLVQSGL